MENVRPVERACYAVAALLVLAGVAHLVPALIWPRPWLGPLSWRKPITFGLSFGTVLAAVTWVTSYLRLRGRTRAWLLGVFAVDCVVEVTGISVQAWRHVPSHFNNVGSFNAAIAYMLAFGGALLIVTLGAFAITAFSGRIDADPAMRLALRVGFALLLAGLAAGAAMIARAETLIQQGHRMAGYDGAGFLKWFHAVTLHAVLVLPALAWWLARTDRPEQRRRAIVWYAVDAYLVAAGAALVVGIILI